MQTKTKTETGYTLNTDGITITVKEKEKHSIEDLKQHLIEVLIKMERYSMEEVELIKMLFGEENKKTYIQREVPIYACNKNWYKFSNLEE